MKRAEETCTGTDGRMKDRRKTGLPTSMNEPTKELRTVSYVDRDPRTDDHVNYLTSSC